MADLIDRNALKERYYEKMKELLQVTTDHVSDEAISLLCGSSLLIDAPTVDAEPVRRGYWVSEPDRERHWHCSECGTVQGMTAMAMNYCPNCGARMAEHPWAASGCGQTFSPD